MRLTGQFAVALPPAEAFGLFTPLGEREWAADWAPRFPEATDDDSAPGTVFQTGTDTVWVVLDRVPGQLMRYSRITPTVDAGTVTVTLDGAGPGSTVTVTYELTALTDAGRKRLANLSAGYDAFLTGWADAIAAALAARGAHERG